LLPDSSLPQVTIYNHNWWTCAWAVFPFNTLFLATEMASNDDAENSYPPSLTASESEQLVSTIKDWSIAHGLAVRPSLAFVSPEADPHGVLATTAPVTLFPSWFPRVCFEQAKSIQKAYNRLYAAIAQDESFLGEIVQE
jgi:glutathione synthase